MIKTISRHLVAISIMISVAFHLSCYPPCTLIRNNSSNIDSEITVRVILARSSQPLSVSSDSEISVYSMKNRTLIHRSMGKTIKFAPDRVSEKILVRSENGSISLNNTAYRGALEILNKGGSLLAINILKIDEYLSSVVPSEIPSSWPEETLKAQAVASRTYTMYHIKKTRYNEIYDLDATTNFQVYKGMSAEDEKTTKAVYSTSGQIISDRTEPICAYFHSTCGGKTADDLNVWKGSDLGYLEEVECGYCAGSPSYEWTAELNLGEIRSVISNTYGKIGKIRRISFHKESGRVTDVLIAHSSGELTLSGNKFRMLFPSNRIKSLYFECEKSDTGLVINGKGYGHGVGLCQYGAKGMAENGSTYKEILEHYYSGVDIISIADSTSSYLANY